MASTLSFKSTVFHYFPPSSSPFKVPNKTQIFITPFPRVGIHHMNLKPTLTRRLFLPSVSGIWDAITGGNPSRDAVIAIRKGMLLFRQGDVLGSLAEFDKAIELDSRQKICGKGDYLSTISIEFVDKEQKNVYLFRRFEEGAEQFRLDVAQNPNDTEESIWCFLCEAQLYGVEEARKRYLEVGKDPRPVMREAYNMFRDGGDPEKLVAAFSNGRDSDYFYAALYAGLYYEAENKPDDAKRHLLAASQSPYGQGSDDYMASLAKVHCVCRNLSSAL